ncbi:cell wall metabolism sensor histidine kinase WalK [Neobacillus niacini]|uniref:sensor histidine kinase n=1 Tax=Neobacillus niacini TaxID=86668 RepID=UPI0021CB467B|nr:HAMP domain-containing sensor histidine kinase [Neobacillus niacini]MCM3767267.1 HAMP domain-containing histidine kinase [Neobacillus niacini]
MIYITLTLIVILTFIIVFQNIKIIKISSSIINIIKGNFNERIRISDNNRFLKKLIINLNRLIDEFHKIVVLNKQYEDDRKKMISNISHDLRTPLTSMLGYVEMLKDDQSLSEEERQEYLSIISAKGEFLVDLLEEFYHFSKLDSDDLPIHPRRLNISELLRQCMLSFLKDFEANGIQPKIELPPEDIFVGADQQAVYRMVQNLISNSLKYGSAGNVIGVSLAEQNDSITIEVWDKGRGIPEEDVPYIFNRLYVAEKSRSRRLKGSGLGLSIVKKLVEKHNGNVAVSSIPFERTSFTVTLPKKLRNM